MTINPAMRAVWLLDVDGVLNTVTPLWPDRRREGLAHVDGRPYRLRWSGDLTHRIATLHESGGAEVRWSTTWVDHIHQIEHLMNLPRLATAFTGVDPDSLDASAMKVQAALNVVEIEQRPLIWTDDLAVPLEGPIRERLLDAGPPVLLIRPHSQLGLQPGDLRAIDDFVADLSALAS